MGKNIIDSNKFGHKNKIGEFKYIDIKDLVNNIKDNTISKIDAKKCLNTLNKTKNAEIKYKRVIPGQKEFILSHIILTDKTLMSSKNENEKLKEGKEKLKEENENENQNENGNEDEDDETMSQNKIK